MASFLTSVTPADRNGNATGAAVTDFAPTASFDWGRAPIKAAISGRMASKRYVQMRQGKVRTATATWKFRTFAEVATILTMFEPEYVLITYQDAQTGAQKTSHMCVENMQASAALTYADGKWETVTVTMEQATPDAG